MAKAGGRKKSERAKADRTDRRRLNKARAVATNAGRNVAIAIKQFNEAVRTLLGARPGSPVEVRSAKAVRAATKGLVASRKKLRKAEKKRRKAALRLRKIHTRGAVVASKSNRQIRKTRHRNPERQPR